jgi:hypothetical protein
MWRKKQVEVERERKTEGDKIPSLLRERRGRPLLVTLAPFLPFLRETFALP